jgi:hypothetical protein
MSDIQNLMSNRDGKLPTPSWGKGKKDITQCNIQND